MADDEKPKRKATPATRKGNGPGWGGPAKGAGQQGVGNSGGRRPKEIEALMRAEREERIAALTAHLTTLAFEAEQENIRFQATVAALNRLEGTPISRSMKVDGDDLSKLSDAELAARREALERAEAEARGRNASAVGAGESARLVN
jgi:hypothetical protein